MLDLFDAGVARRPGAPALTDDRSMRTYGQLSDDANRYASLLWRSGAGPESLIALIADRGMDYVAMTIGVLRAGAAFLPVEPHMPLPRARQMIVAAKPALLLAGPGHQAYAAELGAETAALLDLDMTHAQGRNPASPEPVARQPTSLTYVLFTSGSTGRPKGVMIADDGMANHIAAKTADLGLTDSDVVGFTAALSFDISVWQMLAPLTVGATVAIAAPVNLSEPAELARWVRRHGVTVLEIVPSFLAVVLDELAGSAGLREAMRSLRCLIATGEALPARLVRRWYELFPDIPVVNAYGPTECSDDVTHHVVTAADITVGDWAPLGHEIDDTRVYVTGPDGRELGPGLAGDLLVGGRGVGRGYLRDPALTALLFVPDYLSGQPAARLYRTGDRGLRQSGGVLTFLGRADRQVKVRGHRVELGDVEAMLLSLPGVTAAACVFEQARLAAFVTVSQESGLREDQVRELLRASAPAHLIPGLITILERMPTTGSGKVDYRALARQPESGGTAELTAGAGELTARIGIEQVCAFVAGALGVAAVGPADNFFAAGGDSLGAMNLVSLVRTRFHADGTSLSEFLADPTPAGLLAAIRQAAARPAPASQVPARGAVSAGQERLWFVEQFHGHGPQLIRLMLTLHGKLSTDALVHALNAIVSRHEPLRTVFSADRGIPVGSIWPSAVVTLDRAGSGAEAASGMLNGSRLSARTGQPPLMAASIARIDDTEHLLTLVMHHLVADGWSLAVFGREVATYYQRWHDGELDVPRLGTTYSEYISQERAWLDSDDAAECACYWTQQLSGAEPEIRLPFDRPAIPQPDSPASAVAHEFTTAETTALRAFAKTHRATPFMVIMAAFAAVLRDLSGSHDLSVGIDSVNRSWPGSEELIGTFVNQLPVRLRIAADSCFGDLVDLVRDQCLDAYRHDRLPFHKIVAAVNPPRRSGRFPLFQVKVTHQSAWRRTVAVAGLTIEPTEMSEPLTDLDLMLDMSGENDQLRLELLYRSGVLDERSAKAWIWRIGGVLCAGVADPSVPVGLRTSSGGDSDG